MIRTTRVRKSLTWRKVGDSIVVLDLDSSTYLSIEGSGVVVWELVAAGAPVDAIVDALVAEYDVDIDEARADVIAFLDDLQARSLLT
jgi:Coenzyme PQQ synthesis protein D (PqqD)